MYSSTYFPLFLWGEVAIFLFWFGWDFAELVDIVAFVFHDTAWTPVKPQWRLFKAFGGGRGRIQSNLARIQLHLSFRVLFSRICGVSSRIWGVSSWICGVSSWVWGVPSRIGGVSSGFEGKISIGALDIFNGGVKIQWWYWKGAMGALKKSGGGIV